MKIRSGFVSNSSSSSFVILGIVLDKNNDILEKNPKLKYEGYDSANWHENEDESETVIGIPIARFSDEGEESEEFDLEELQNKIVKMRKDFGLDGNAKLKIFTGTEMN